MPQLGQMCSLYITLQTPSEDHRDGHVFQGRGHRGQSLVKRTQAAVCYACERLNVEHYGTRGFRRTWAQERYQGPLELGMFLGDLFPQFTPL